MKQNDPTRWLLLSFLLATFSQPAFAIELLQAVEGGDYDRIFSRPGGLRVADDGTVYVTGTRSGDLLQIVDGNISALPLESNGFDGSGLGGIDVMADGSVVVASWDSGQVTVLGEDLKPAVVFSKDGGGPGELDSPSTVSVSINDRIHVADAGNNRVSVFNSQGLFLSVLGYGGGDVAALKSPGHIEIDAEENIYVLEGKGQVSIFNRYGELLERLDQKTLRELIGSSSDFTAMTVDNDGYLYLGAGATGKIHIIDWKNRQQLSEFGSRGRNRSQYTRIDFISVNNTGQLAILDSYNEKVEVWQLDQTEFNKPVIADRIRFGGEADISCDSAYAFINDQTLCINGRDRKIYVLAADGSVSGEFGEAAKSPEKLDVGPKTVAILDDNDLHVYTHDNKLVFSAGGWGISEGNLVDPVDVFVDGETYWVAEGASKNNRIQQFAGDGRFLRVIKPRDGKQVNFAKAGPVAVDSEGNVYIADAGGSGLIRVVDQSSQVINEIGISGDSPQKVTEFHDLDIDRQDRLYVAATSEIGEFQIRVYQEGAPVMQFGAAEANDTLGYFDEPTSMTVYSGEKNRVYVSDADRNKVLWFDVFEYPDAAFGLQISADKQQVDFNWSSSGSPLIASYEIQAAASKEGPFEVVATSEQNSLTVDGDSVSDFSWFRIQSSSAFGLKAEVSAARQNIFQKMVSLREQGNHEEAIQTAELLLKMSPANEDARDLMGQSLMEIGNYTRAISEYRILEESDTYRDKAIRAQLNALVALEQFVDASELILSVMDSEPKELEPYLICSRVSLKMGDAITAVTCAEDGLELHESNSELRFLLGRAYIEAGIPEDGLLAFEIIIEQDPDNLEVMVDIAEQYYQLGEYELSLERYDAILASGSGNGAASMGKARSLISLDRDQEARSIATRLTSKKETRGEGHYLLGKIAAKAGKHKEAVLRFTRASKDKPEVVDAWTSLASSYLEINDQRKAVRSLEQGLKKNPESFELYALAGKVELEREQYQEANSYLGQAVNLNPQSMEAQRDYARALFATRKYRSAAIHAEVAAEIAPDDIDILVLQADIANQQGKVGSAIEFLKTAISEQPASPELQFRLGRVYQDANLFDDSREHLEKAASIRPNWAEPVTALGFLNMKRRRFDDAIGYFEKAVEIDPSDESRANLNIAFAERKKSLEFSQNAPQLVLSDLNLQRVFSAAYKRYQDEPIGTVQLENAAATDYGNLKLTFQIKEYMDFPSSVDIPLLKGNESREVPIMATFNNRILEVDEDTGVQVEVKLAYVRDGQDDEISLTQPMTIYGKNAIVWSDSAMVGSFVTPKDDTLRDYTRQVINSYMPEAGPLNDKLVTAMTLFSSLTASGTKYIVDPNTPFTDLRDDQIDYVQFPRETLFLRSGDCDDLSVLISAKLENLGISTVLLEVPGHLFLMFDTGVPEADMELISHDPSLLALHNGTVWIPLEATMVNTSFTEAWAEGANKYQNALAANELGLIDMASAWQEYQPVTLQKADFSIALPDEKRTRNLIDQSSKKLLNRSVDRMVRPYQTMVASDPQNIIARLQIAIMYTRFGLYPEARIAFDALNELDPDNSAVATNEGNFYFLQEDFQRAEQSYARAASLDETDGGILINLAMAQYKLGDIDQAKSSFDRAKSLTPEVVSDYEAFGKLLNQ